MKDYFKDFNERDYDFEKFYSEDEDENEDENEDEDEDDIITLTDETGEETDFIIIDYVAVENQLYLLVIKADDIDADEPEAIILKQCCIDEDEVIYELVEDEKEFNKVYIMLQDNDSDYDMKLE